MAGRFTSVNPGYDVLERLFVVAKNRPRTSTRAWTIILLKVRDMTAACGVFCYVLDLPVGVKLSYHSARKCYMPNNMTAESKNQSAVTQNRQKRERQW